MEFARQCLWPELEVYLVSTTDSWAQLAIAGPKSRNLIEALVDDFDLSNEAFPYMACGELTICNGLRARLFRLSFSGELAYELAVPTAYGHALIERLMEVGKDYDITPYGTEALSVLRIEKGHVAGAEVNGQTTAQMMGLGKMVSKQKDSIGAVMSRREGLSQSDTQLVGLICEGETSRIATGSHLFKLNDEQNMDTDKGWVSSSCYSPHLKTYIGLGYLMNGEDLKGERLVAANPLENETCIVKIVSPHFIDPEGDRLRV
jgi:sarcosine oxidase subunit alpha